MKEKLGKEGVYIRNDLTYKIRNDLCISDGDREILTIKLLAKGMKSIMFHVAINHPMVIGKNHCDHLQKFLTNATIENRLYFITKNFNINF